MGKKDEYQYDYLDDNGRFADQVNGALFGGKQVVKPEEVLEPADALNIYLGKDDEYHTGLRLLFEVIRYGRDKKQLQRIMEENREIYTNLDGDTRELLEVMANVKFSVQNSLIEREEGFSMLKAFEDMRMEGKIEGKIEAILELLEEFGQIPQRISETVKTEDNFSQCWTSATGPKHPSRHSRYNRTSSIVKCNRINSIVKNTCASTRTKEHSSCSLLAGIKSGTGSPFRSRHPVPFKFFLNFGYYTYILDIASA